MVCSSFNGTYLENKERQCACQVLHLFSCDVNASSPAAFVSWMCMDHPMWTNHAALDEKNICNINNKTQYWWMISNAVHAWMKLPALHLHFWYQVSMAVRGSSPFHYMQMSCLFFFSVLQWNFFTHKKPFRYD